MHNRGMTTVFPALTETPDPQFVMVGDGYRIATYEWGPADAPTVLLVHGFASSARDNWVNTGWVRDLLRAGYRVLAVDQRGHGASDKPHVAEAYALGAVDHLVRPLVPVILRAKVLGFVELFRTTAQLERQAEQLRALGRRRWEAGRGPGAEARERARGELGHLAAVEPLPR